MPQQEMFTLLETATRLGLSERTIRRAVQEGKIKAVQMGRVYRISDEEIARVKREGLKASTEQE